MDEARVREAFDHLVAQLPDPPDPSTTYRRASTRRRVRHRRRNLALAGVLVGAALLGTAIAVQRDGDPNLVVAEPSGDSTLAPNPTQSEPSAAQLQRGPETPTCLAVRSDGALVVCDFDSGVVFTSRDLSTFDELTQVAQPIRAVADDAGNVYVSDNTRHIVSRIDMAGTVVVVAGTGMSDYSGDGGPAESAALSSPSDLALAPDGSLYIADRGNYRIRRVSADGIITTVAGSGTGGTGGDGGPALAAAMEPAAIAFDSVGNLYVANASPKTLRRISPDGVITTVLEQGWFTDLASGTSAIYAADFGAWGISRINADGSVDRLALELPHGTRPSAVAVAPDGSIYASDNGGASDGKPKLIRVAADGEVSELLK